MPLEETLERAMHVNAGVQALHEAVRETLTEFNNKLKQAQNKLKGFTTSTLVSKIVSGEIHSVTQLLEFYSSKRETRKEVKDFENTVKSLGRQYATIAAAANALAGIPTTSKHLQKVEEIKREELQKLGALDFKERKKFLADAIKEMKRELRRARLDLFKQRVLASVLKPYYETRFALAIGPARVKKIYFIHSISPYTLSLLQLRFMKLPDYKKKKLEERVEKRITGLREAGLKLNGLIKQKRQTRENYAQTVGLLKVIGAAYSKAYWGALFGRKT